MYFFYLNTFLNTKLTGRYCLIAYYVERKKEKGKINRRSFKIVNTMFLLIPIDNITNVLCYVII